MTDQPPHDPTAAPVSGQPWSTPSGDTLSGKPVPAYEPPAGPRPPQPGHTAYLPGAAYPPTTEFPAYQPPPPAYGPGPGPTYAPTEPPPPRRSNVPLIAVIVAVSLLLCGGVATAGVLAFQAVRSSAEEAVEPILREPPPPPAVPTEIPQLPTEIPGLPELPDLPTELPDIPFVPGGDPLAVVYEVTGDGPVDILYAEKLAESPKRLTDVKLPWKASTTMDGIAFVSVTAIRKRAGEGSIECRATVDGEEAATASRTGPYATVSCNKMIVE